MRFAPRGTQLECALFVRYGVIDRPLHALEHASLPVSLGVHLVERQGAVDFVPSKL
jgi:hypothetical protein